MSRIYTALAALGGFAVFLLTFWRKAQSVQRKEDAAEATQARLETIQDAQERHDEIENLDADERARRLDGLWSDDTDK